MPRAPYAVAIVGGGPAGTSTALFLAHHAPELRGRILVIEKERYPREKFCAGAVGARADALLATIGVTIDVPSAPIGGLKAVAQGESVTARLAGAGRVVRRIEFDHALASRARARGIEVRDGVRVLDVLVEPRGVVVETDQGPIRADVVVGADGVGSLVRRVLGVPRARYVAQAVEVDTEWRPTDAPNDVIVFDLSRTDVRGYTWDFPTVVGGESKVCRGVYALKSDGGAAVEIDDVLRTELARRGLDVARYRKKRYAERGYHAPLSLSARRVLLVGEAAGIDPVTGEGIAQAVQYGSTAGEYLAQKLRTKDFFFDDWHRAIRGSSVGRDLLVRSSLVELAYGRYRSDIERFILSTPEFLRVGLQHFSGQPWTKRDVLHFGLRGALATLHAKVRDAGATAALSSAAAGRLR